MRGRRGLLTAVAADVLAGAVALLVAGRVWRSVAVTATTGARIHVDVTGHAAVPALSGLGVALLVLGAGVVAARGGLRRGVGLVVGLVGGVLVAACLTSGDDVADVVRDKAFGVSGAQAGSGLSGWAVVGALAGVIAVASGASTVLGGHRWPGLGSRYEPPGTDAGTSSGAASAGSMWDALDRGDDPTAAPRQ